MKRVVFFFLFYEAFADVYNICLDVDYRLLYEVGFRLSSFYIIYDGVYILFFIHLLVLSLYLMVGYLEYNIRFCVYFSIICQYITFSIFYKLFIRLIIGMLK